MSYLREKLPQADIAPVELEPWRKALLDAAQIVRQRGWFQYCEGAEVGPLGSVCAIIAIGNALENVDDLDQRCKARTKFQDFIGTVSVPGWNDTAGRTAAEVIAALDAAARS